MYDNVFSDNLTKTDFFVLLQSAADNQPVIVDVDINYSKRTRFTKGIVQTNPGRFPLRGKVRFIGRALKRKITG